MIVAKPTFNVPAKVETPVYVEFKLSCNVSFAFVNVAAVPVTSKL